MVIFGAGASHDSDAQHPVGEIGSAHARPPLAEGIVAPRYRYIANHYPASIAVIDYIQQIFGDGNETDTLETILARYAARAENRSAARQALVAFRFYLCELITNMTNQWLDDANGHTIYVTLLNQLLEWQEETGQRVQLVTFNYDTLLEDAAERVIPDWRFDSMNAYTSRTDWGLLRLHGSVSWSRVLESQEGMGEPNAMRAVTHASGVAHPNLPRVLRNAITLDHAPEPIHVPALAVPMANKTTFECDPMHIEAFRNTIPHIDRLLVCGWRGAEAHAVEILNDINPGYRLGIVSGGRGDLVEVETNLGAVYRKGKLALTQVAGMSTFANDMRSQLRPLLAPLR